MISYNNAVQAAAHETLNMPDYEVNPTKFIEWAEDICILLSKIYHVEYDQVCQDLQEALGFPDDDEVQEL